AADTRNKADQERMARAVRQATSHLAAARDQAAAKGYTNLVVHYFHPSLIVEQDGMLWRTKELPDFRTEELTGLTRAIHDWCVGEAATSGVTVKIVSLGYHWIAAHHTHVLGITMDWANQGEEQVPYLAEPLRLTDLY